MFVFGVKVYGADAARLAGTFLTSFNDGGAIITSGTASSSSVLAMRLVFLLL